MRAERRCPIHGVALDDGLSCPTKEHPTEAEIVLALRTNRNARRSRLNLANWMLDRWDVVDADTGKLLQSVQGECRIDSFVGDETSITLHGRTEAGFAKVRP